MKRLIVLATGLIVTFLVASVVSMPPAIALFEGAKDQVCKGANLDNNATCTADSAGGIEKVVATGLNIFSVVVGIIAVIMIIIGGLRYVTSGGDSNSVNAAKNTILYSVVGLVVVALAQIIVRFVLNKTSLPTCPSGQTQISAPGDCIVP